MSGGEAVREDTYHEGTEDANHVLSEGEGSSQSDDRISLID